MFNISEADLCALRSRFRRTLVDDKLVIHCLPNHLIVITFNPDYIRNCQTIEMCDYQLQNEITPNDIICKTDKDDIHFNIGGLLIDYNFNAPDEINKFQTGITSSFLAIIQPNQSLLTLPESFQSVF